MRPPATTVLTGQFLWRHANPVRFFQWQGGAGPRATPAGRYLLVRNDREAVCYRLPVQATFRDDESSR